MIRVAFVLEENSESKDELNYCTLLLAFCNQNRLGNTSYIAHSRNTNTIDYLEQNSVLHDALKKFKLITYDQKDASTLETIIMENKIRIFYRLTKGEKDNLSSRIATTCIHCTEVCNKPNQFGDLYEMSPFWKVGKYRKEHLDNFDYNIEEHTSELKKLFDKAMQIVPTFALHYDTNIGNMKQKVIGIFLGSNLSNETLVFSTKLDNVEKVVEENKEVEKVIEANKEEERVTNHTDIKSYKVLEEIKTIIQSKYSKGK